MICLLAKRRAGSHLRPPAHEALDHASLSSDGLWSPWLHAHVAHAGTLFWCVGINVSTRWRLRHCLKCHARKAYRLTVRWPIISTPLLEGPGVAFSVGYFGPLPVTPRGTYILLFTDRFDRQADTFPVTAAEFPAQGTANILVKQYTLLWGHILGQRPVVLLQAFTRAVYQLLGVRNLRCKLLSSQL